MRNVLISVIVPVYKVEQYLPRCIESIINQTFENLEIILVDDGSPDNCGEICESYKLLDERIVVVHQKNGGLSCARNTGIDMAKGTYLAFVDSDDWIDADMLEILYNAAISAGAQIAECSFRSVYSDKIIEETECTGAYIEGTSIDAIEGILDWKYFKPVAWDKLYHRDVIADIRYPKRRLHEDEFTTYKFFYNANKIVFVDVSKYNYDCARADSITKNEFTEKHLDSCVAMHERLMFLKQKNITSIEEKNNNVYGWVMLEKLYQAYVHQIKGAKLDEVLKIVSEDLPYLKTRKMQQRYLDDLALIAKRGLRAYGEARKAKEAISVCQR